MNTSTIPSSIIECHADSVWNVQDNVKIVAGKSATLTGGDYCVFSTGTNATITCRDHCIINVGDFSRVKATEYAAVQAGYDCEVRVGPGSRVSAREGTQITFVYWDNDVRLTLSGEVGTDLKPGVQYHVRRGQIVEHESATLTKA
ncbi:TPA: hypothetical protein ACF3I9_004390 [Klebsiella aerogenes]